LFTPLLAANLGTQGLEEDALLHIDHMDPLRGGEESSQCRSKR
jgi:hypothetical protein